MDRHLSALPPAKKWISRHWPRNWKRGVEMFEKIRGKPKAFCGGKFEKVLLFVVLIYDWLMARQQLKKETWVQSNSLSFYCGSTLTYNLDESWHEHLDIIQSKEKKHWRKNLEWIS